MISSSNKILEYPEFIEASLKTIDPFWSSIFEKLAEGKPPRGLSISTVGTIHHNSRKHKFSYYFKGKNGDEIFRDLYQLLSVKLGLISPYEKDQEIKNIHKKSTAVITDWGSIKKKNIKDDFISEFVAEKSEDFDLTTDQSKDLVEYINCYLKLGFIKGSDIIFEDNRINEIKGITFEDKKFKIEIPIIEKKGQPSDDKNENIESKSISSKWNKFIEKM